MYVVTLKIDDMEYILNRVNFYVARKSDKNGRPISESAWTVNIHMDTTDESLFTEWMVDPTKKKDVSLKFYEGGDTKKEWQFAKAYCVGFQENFVADAGVMETQLIISGTTVENGNATINNNWTT
ncbi:type VI secretion system tube protein TssD [Spirosoma gilvum]